MTTATMSTSVFAWLSIREPKAADKNELSQIAIDFAGPVNCSAERKNVNVAGLLRLCSFG